MEPEQELSPHVRHPRGRHRLLPGDQNPTEGSFGRHGASSGLRLVLYFSEAEERWASDRLLCV